MEIRIDDWMGWLKAKNLSDRSIKNYNFYLEKFDAGSMNQDYVIKFLNRYKNNDVVRAFLKNFFEFIILNSQNHQEIEYIRDIQLPKSRKKKRQKSINILSMGEIRMIVDSLPNIKYKLMTLVMFYGGLRFEELCGSKWDEKLGITLMSFNWRKWIEDENQYCELMVFGKNKKYRRVYIPPEVVISLRKWINESFALNHAQTDRLFNMSESGWWDILGKYSLKAIGRRVNPHLLRHSSATFLHRNGCKIEYIKEYLGHENIGTTMIYVHLDGSKVQDEVTKAFEKN